MTKQPPLKLLILVQSCLAYPYNGMFIAARRTWDQPCESTETAWYVGMPNIDMTKVDIHGDRPDGGVIFAPCSDDLDHRHTKFQHALRAVWDWDWDMMFRTNVSSYVDKAMTLVKARTLPKHNCYCGKSGGDFASGCGVFLSRNVCEILKNEIKGDEPIRAEDWHMGQILAEHGIFVTPGAERFDYWWNAGPHGTVEIVDCYHYRCKPMPGHEKDRDHDIKAFKAIHEFKMQKAAATK